jgi:hypothetical protein
MFTPPPVASTKADARFDSQYSFSKKREIGTTKETAIRTIIKASLTNFTDLSKIGLLFNKFLNEYLRMNIKILFNSR